MKLLKPGVPGDFSSVMLNDALHTIKESGIEPKDTFMRLLLSSEYRHHEIVTGIFECRGKLDIPFEISYILPRDSWLLFDDDSFLFYSEGA